MDSIFTKIINREIPASIVYEDEQVIAFNDINPIAPVHILIVPKKQIPTINDLEQDDATLMGLLILRAKDIAKNLGIAERGYRLIFNCNKEACQTVFHIHLHLIGGKQLGWNQD
ncbi:MAG TPA: histidine triad nucleotide-binding protein [Candidatus Kapabacteria bacterium]|nr:histidine triad nucleotide-binding protein [Candidatus Kapabacteria bacterium]